MSGAGQEPSEEQLRAAYEAELARVTAGDMIAQSAVSLLNVGAFRMGPPPGAEPEQGAPTRDLEQVRDAIDAARALLEILGRRMPADQLAPLRDALSRLQMAYVSEVGAAPEGEAGEEPGGRAQPQQPPQPQTTTQQPPARPQEPGERRPGPAESSGRLWVPGR